MIDPGMPLGPLDAGAFRSHAVRRAASEAPVAGFGAVLSRELEGPPPELRGQVDAAARRWEELQAVGRELHFEVDADTGRVLVEVRDLDGRLVGTMPPSGALEIAAGAPLP